MTIWDWRLTWDNKRSKCCLSLLMGFSRFLKLSFLFLSTKLAPRTYPPLRERKRFGLPRRRCCHLSSELKKKEKGDCYCDASQRESKSRERETGCSTVFSSQKAKLCPYLSTWVTVPWYKYKNCKWEREQRSMHLWKTFHKYGNEAFLEIRKRSPHDFHYRFWGRTCFNGSIKGTQSNLKQISSAAPGVSSCVLCGPPTPLVRMTNTLHSVKVIF